MARMDCTNILVDAPGLRPTASEAFIPINPTPMAAPNAAMPTWRFPLNPAVNEFIVPAFLCVLADTRDRTGSSWRTSLFSLGLCCRCRLLGLTNQQREHRAQQHEHQRLHEAHQ